MKRYKICIIWILLKLYNGRLEEQTESYLICQNIITECIQNIYQPSDNHSSPSITHHKNKSPTRSIEKLKIKIGEQQPIEKLKITPEKLAKNAKLKHKKHKLKSKKLSPDKKEAIKMKIVTPKSRKSLKLLQKKNSAKLNKKSDVVNSFQNTTSKDPASPPKKYSFFKSKNTDSPNDNLVSTSINRFCQKIIYN